MVTNHSWPIFEKIEVQNLDAWMDREGNVGGSYDFYLEFSWGAHILTHEDVVCLSVDPATRQAWLVGVRYQGGQPHYSIAQLRDYAPEAKGETGKDRSDRVDMFTGRSMISSEGPDFCQQQPDLPSIPVDEFGFPPTELFPVASGDLRIQLGGRR